MTKRWEDLPEECWEWIFDRLDGNRHFEALSLVCKRFLSIANRLRSDLIVSDATIRLHRTITPLLRRFHQLKRIDIVHIHGDLDLLVCEIALSGLNIEALNISQQRRIPVESFKEWGSKMKSLKILICSRLRFLQDSDLVAVSDSFPSLEELDISYPEHDFGSLPDENSHNDPFPGAVTDAGIIAASAKLRSLCKLNLSGNQFITDRSLLALSSNCLFLREIAVRGCSFISQNGIRSVINQSPNLSSLLISGNKIPLSFTVESSFFCGRSLSTLDFSQMLIPDNFLYSIREANLPLKKLSLSRCRGFSFIALSSLLSEYQSLNQLNLEGAHILKDRSVMDLSKYLFHLISINLSSCFHLTNSTFYTLAKSCPFLEVIQMERTGLGSRDEFTTTDYDLVKNTHIQSVKLGWNKCLSDETLNKLGLIFPKLRLLDVSHCWNITETGIGEIAKSCCETLRELNVSGCEGIKNLGTVSKFSALEVLQAAGTGMDDKGLSMVGQSCRRILRLDLEGCLGVTTKGVKEVVGKCKGLREMSLNKCCNVGVEVLAWMVLSRTSLQKVIPPYSLTEKEKDLFLRHGCLVSMD